MSARANYKSELSMRMRFGLLCLLVPVLLLTGLTGLTGCSQKKNKPAQTPPPALLRVVNAVVDSPALGLTISSAAAGSVGYRESTALSSVTAGTIPVTVTFTDPATQATVNLFTAVQVPVAEGHDVSLILKGTMAAPTSQIVDITASTLTSTQTQVAFANASSKGNLDIYLTNFDTALSAATPSATLNTGAASAAKAITADTRFRLRVTAAGSPTVIYDSAEFPIAAGARRLIVVTDDFGPDPGAVGPLVLTDSSALTFPNSIAKSGVRVLNAVPDQVSETITLATRATPSVNIRGPVALAVNELTPLDRVAAASVGVHTVAASDNTLTFDSSAFTLIEGTLHTIVLAGTSTNPKRQSAAIISSDRRPIKTNTRFQFLNAAHASTGTVDVYFVDSSHKLDNSTASFTNLSFLSNGTVLLVPSVLDIFVTTPGSKSVIVGPIRLTVTGGQSFLLVLGESAGGGEPLTLTAINDTNAIPAP